MKISLNTKDRIVIAASELFFKFGIRGITMDDIAKHLGISKKTLYQFFDDKDAIVMNLMQKQLAENEKDMICLRDNSKNAIHEMLDVMKHLGEMFGRINPIIFYEMQKYHPKAWQQFRDFKEKCASKMVEENILMGIEQGLYRKNIDAKIMSWMRMEQVEWAMKAEQRPNNNNIAELQLALLDHFLHGICTIKGHKLINEYHKINEDE